MNDALGQRLRLVAIGSAATLAFTAVAFSVSTVAGAQSNGQYSLDAAGFRSTSIPAPLRAEIAATLGRDAAAFGINDASYDAARLITSTSRGPLYALFGERGTCLYLAEATACGHPGTVDEPILAIARSDSDGHVIGGGIAATSVRQVALAVPDHPSIRLAVVDGAFSVPRTADARAGSGTHFEVAGEAGIP